MNKFNATIIDYGVGNLMSVRRGLEYVGASVNITSDPDKLADASHIILPGVGAFSNAMEALTNLNLTEAIINCANKGIPLLAICLGMQLLLDESEEFGNTRGLGLISGSVISLNSQEGIEKLKIPHIGWGVLNRMRKEISWRNTILENLREGESLYFVHSFKAIPRNDDHILAICKYGENDIASVIVKDNVMGCQFHPEKSGEVGLKILKKFLTI
ncbi:imidazole glycerol phosphate synthase subunit HisH [Leptospira levettii]|uniref:imidazole glycerol phosphate synthase subunit HisH n=1 Tax=Leptospira levettii TaxID=2023178 RepID=UPI00223DAC1B|nr:imidazole glycerol phosphate synthase subunit HisH [Leptospira levettii]MCW7497020.1 imidazole glycerol phosphate synthase subunit HisH [Leptospira levettii]